MNIRTVDKCFCSTNPLATVHLFCSTEDPGEPGSSAKIHISSTGHSFMFGAAHREERFSQDSSPLYIHDIDYEGEHISLSVPLKVEITGYGFRKFQVKSEELCIWGLGRTVDAAKYDFCGAFMGLYELAMQYHPRTNRQLSEVLYHVGVI